MVVDKMRKYLECPSAEAKACRDHLIEKGANTERLKDQKPLSQGTCFERLAECDDFEGALGVVKRAD